MNMNYTPKEIVEKLNKYIISQDEAKKNVAIALRNRYRRKEIQDIELKKEIIPKNIILIGSTGVGKTEIARRLAKIANAPFIKVEATKYTEVGYVGKDVESIVKDLVALTFRMVQNEKAKELREKYIEKVYEIIAKKLFSYETINDDKKEEIIEKIKSGEYDESEIEIKPHSKSISPVIEVYSNGRGDGPEGLGNITEMLDDLVSGLSGKPQKQKKIKVKNAIEILLQEEINENTNKEDLIREAINKVENDGIIFIDEIDKIAERGTRSEVSRQGVQRDILPIVEGTTVMTKYGPVKTDHILFIAAGAFSMTKPSDLMPELQGRFPVRVELKNLSKDDFVKILTNVKNNLVYQYIKLLEVEDVTLEVTDEAVDKIAEYAILLNEKIENIGARRLHSVIEKVLKDILFEAPYGENRKIILKGKDIDDKFKGAIKKENLENYIL
ncbi:ATP-dependent protease ATPase subunit HslU [Haliovirga abyssi]|uniref:ATP-dependent protease ATPase subunit HslU n=1 Tax=Haliovirga abyssi TaxID=2996794 RepID=A0AAU9DHU4_9FUSO|nr:ATP-dependent protease ATPase subunit HslU [Haliovirga abyssi]BDU50324.1 ATP-dependent protease ATPase subunit HslU [Haliovirga abyssi]